MRVRSLREVVFELNVVLPKTSEAKTVILAQALTPTLSQKGEGERNVSNKSLTPDPFSNDGLKSVMPLSVLSLRFSQPGVLASSIDAY